MIATLLTTLATTLLAFPALTGTTLPDKSTVVVTTDGLFLVRAGQVANHLLMPADFGPPTMVAPSVTWIRDTDEFFVTNRHADLTGGIWRVTVPDVGPAVITDLTTFLDPAFGRDFTDATYSRGLDTLFVLNRIDGLILSLVDPANAGVEDFEIWSTLTPGEGLSIAANGAVWPFGLIVAQRTEPLIRLTKTGSTALYDLMTWEQIGSNPVTGEWYVGHGDENIVGIVGGGSFGGIGPVINFNNQGLCPKPVKGTVDFVWDPVARRAVTIGEESVQCLFGGAATGPNHIVRLPFTAGGGPASNVAVLLSAIGDSGITGVDGDIDHVRRDASDKTFFGDAGVAGSGGKPRFMSGGYGTVLPIDDDGVLGLENAPPGALAVLVLGGSLISATVQGQTFYPDNDLLIYLATDAEGEVVLTLSVPNDPLLLGLQSYWQWWIDDTTTPELGDLVASHAAVITTGVK